MYKTRKQTIFHLRNNFKLMHATNSYKIGNHYILKLYLKLYIYIPVFICCIQLLMNYYALAKPFQTMYH